MQGGGGLGKLIRVAQTMGRDAEREQFAQQLAHYNSRKRASKR